MYSDYDSILKSMNEKSTNLENSTKILIHDYKLKKKQTKYGKKDLHSKNNIMIYNHTINQDELKRINDDHTNIVNQGFNFLLEKFYNKNQ